MKNSSRKQAALAPSSSGPPPMDLGLGMEPVNRWTAHCLACVELYNSGINSPGVPPPPDISQVVEKLFSQGSRDPRAGEETLRQLKEQQDLLCPLPPVTIHLEHVVNDLKAIGAGNDGDLQALQPRMHVPGPSLVSCARSRMLSHLAGLGYAELQSRTASAAAASASTSNDESSSLTAVGDTSSLNRERARVRLLASEALMGLGSCYMFSTKQDAVPAWTAVLTVALALQVFWFEKDPNLEPVNPTQAEQRSTALIKTQRVTAAIRILYSAMAGVGPLSDRAKALLQRLGKEPVPPSIVLTRGGRGSRDPWALPPRGGPSWGPADAGNGAGGPFKQAFGILLLAAEAGSRIEQAKNIDDMLSAAVSVLENPPDGLRASSEQFLLLLRSGGTVDLPDSAPQSSLAASRLSPAAYRLAPAAQKGSKEAKERETAIKVFEALPGTERAAVLRVPVDELSCGLAAADAAAGSLAREDLEAFLHGVPRFPCPCGRAFGSEGELRMHLADVHTRPASAVLPGHALRRSLARIDVEPYAAAGAASASTAAPSGAAEGEAMAAANATSTLAVNAGVGAAEARMEVSGPAPALLPVCCGKCFTTLPCTAIYRISTPGRSTGQRPEFRCRRCVKKEGPGVEIVRDCSLYEIGPGQPRALEDMVEARRKASAEASVAPSPSPPSPLEAFLDSVVQRGAADPRGTLGWVEDSLASGVDASMPGAADAVSDLSILIFGASFILKRSLSPTALTEVPSSIGSLHRCWAAFLAAGCLQRVLPGVGNPPSHLTTTDALKIDLARWDIEGALAIVHPLGRRLVQVAERALAVAADAMTQQAKPGPRSGGAGASVAAPPPTETDVSAVVDLLLSVRESLSHAVEHLESLVDGVEGWLRHCDAVSDSHSFIAPKIPALRETQQLLAILTAAATDLLAELKPRVSGGMGKGAAGAAATGAAPAPAAMLVPLRSVLDEIVEASASAGARSDSLAVLSLDSKSGEVAPSLFLDRVAEPDSDRARQPSSGETSSSGGGAATAAGTLKGSASDPVVQWAVGALEMVPGKASEQQDQAAAVLSSRQLSSLSAGGKTSKRQDRTAAQTFANNNSPSSASGGADSGAGQAMLALEQLEDAAMHAYRLHTASLEADRYFAAADRLSDGRRRYDPKPEPTRALTDRNLLRTLLLLRAARAVAILVGDRQVVSNLIGEDTLLGVDFRAEVSGLQSVPLPVQSLAVWQMTGLFLTGLEALMLHGKDVVDEIEVDHLAPNPMAKDTPAVAPVKDAIPRTFTEHCLSLVDRIAHSVTSATAARGMLLITAFSEVLAAVDRVVSAAGGTPQAVVDAYRSAVIRRLLARKGDVEEAARRRAEEAAEALMLEMEGTEKPAVAAAAPKKKKKGAKKGAAKASRASSTAVSDNEESEEEGKDETTAAPSEPEPARRAAKGSVVGPVASVPAPKGRDASLPPASAAAAAAVASRRESDTSVSHAEPNSSRQQQQGQGKGKGSGGPAAQSPSSAGSSGAKGPGSADGSLSSGPTLGRTNSGGSSSAQSDRQPLPPTGRPRTQPAPVTSGSPRGATTPQGFSSSSPTVATPVRPGAGSTSSGGTQPSGPPPLAPRAVAVAVASVGARDRDRPMNLAPVAVASVGVRPSAPVTVPSPASSSSSSSARAAKPASAAAPSAQGLSLSERPSPTQSPQSAGGSGSFSGMNLMGTGATQAPPPQLTVPETQAAHSRWGAGGLGAASGGLMGPGPIGSGGGAMDSGAGVGGGPFAQQQPRPVGMPAWASAAPSLEGHGLSMAPWSGPLGGTAPYINGAGSQNSSLHQQLEHMLMGLGDAPGPAQMPAGPAGDPLLWSNQAWLPAELGPSPLGSGSGLAYGQPPSSIASRPLAGQNHAYEAPRAFAGLLGGLFSPAASPSKASGGSAAGGGIPGASQPGAGDHASFSSFWESARGDVAIPINRVQLGDPSYLQER